MTDHCRDYFYHSYGNVEDRDKLRDVIRDIQTAGRSVLQDNDNLRKDVEARESTLRSEIANLRKDVKARDKKIECQGYCTCSMDGSRWILAEQDYPEDDSRVVFFNDREFKVRSAGSLKGKCWYTFGTRKL